MVININLICIGICPLIEKKIMGDGDFFRQIILLKMSKKQANKHLKQQRTSKCM